MAMQRADDWVAELLTVRPMMLVDVQNVVQLEQRCFVAPWSKQAFLTELADNHFAQYTVLDYGGRIVGYAGVWMIVDEGHVTNVGVDPDFRGRKLGELLMLTLMNQCRAQGMQRMTLEVRVSNSIAQSLYRKLGFVGVGVRKGYYTDNHEDALIMWAELYPQS